MARLTEDRELRARYHSMRWALSMIEEETENAMDQHRPFSGAHEGYAIILEELEELWDEVKLRKKDDPRLDQMRREAIQVAAMLVRFIVDVTGRPASVSGGDPRCR